jgi:long-chain acyl-CoA synthetase
MSAARPYRWEKSYPPGVLWDAPITTSTLPALLDDSVRRFAERPAIDYRERKITYAELGALVDKAAAGFQRLGIGPGSTVALYFPNTPYHPIAFFGAIKAGARVAHLSPLDAERELAHKLHDSGAKTLVTANVPGMAQLAQKLVASGHAERLVIGDEAHWGPAPVPWVPISGDAKTLSMAHLMDGPAGGAFPALQVEDVAVLQYTGGTTGIPKGAMLSHANLTSAVSIYDAFADPQDALPSVETVIGVLPLFHIYALTTILLRHLKRGSEILLRMRFDVETTLRDIEAKRATTFPAVPTMLIALASHPEIAKKDLSALRYVGSGGAPLPIEVAQRFERLTGQRVGGGWGMTETSPAGTNNPAKGDLKPGSIGLPLPGIVMDVVALDDPRRVLGPGEKGEIRIKGPNVMKGYWNRPEETAASFVDGMFLTGDTGYMDEDGWFFLVDRKKDMILSGGFNVYPRVIEEAIYEHPAIEEVIVIGVPDEYRGQAAKAFVKLRHGATAPSLDELKVFLADKIGKHEMPAALEVRDALPKTPVGKLSKKELVEEERLKHEPAKTA